MRIAVATQLRTHPYLHARGLPSSVSLRAPPPPDPWSPLPLRTEPRSKHHRLLPTCKRDVSWQGACGLCSLLAPLDWLRLVHPRKHTCQCCIVVKACVSCLGLDCREGLVLIECLIALVAAQLLNTIHLHACVTGWGEAWGWGVGGWGGGGIWAGGGGGRVVSKGRFNHPGGIRGPQSSRGLWGYKRINAGVLQGPLPSARQC